MRILITGVCGFVGAALARAIAERMDGVSLTGLDNLSRPGSQTNRVRLRERGVGVVHGDLRLATDVDGIPPVDWVIDAAANPSVLAGLEGGSGSRQVVDNNLGGTINLLEYCKRHRAGLILLSTSRVYSIDALARLPMRVEEDAFCLDERAIAAADVSAEGITENFSTEPPISLYGATKLASETLAREYGRAFGFPVWIDRCGNLAGAGQFGHPGQGIFAFWINAYLRRRPMRFIGFEGSGHQVRDCLHPDDLADLLVAQMTGGTEGKPDVVHASGGRERTMSLAQLTEWCADCFGRHEVSRDTTPRTFDVPWVVLDARRAQEAWKWETKRSLESILTEIATHAKEHPEWLDLSAMT